VVDGLRSGSGKHAAERLTKATAKLDAAVHRVALSEAQYGRAQANSVVDTWKFCTLHVPAVVCSLKAAEHARSEELHSMQWLVLDEMSKLPERLATVVEAATMAAAQQKGERWLDATL